MAIRLWPQDFERKDHLTKEEKTLLRFAGKNFPNGHFAVSIDPVGLSNENVKMGMYISPTEGLVTFSIYTGDPEPVMADSYPAYVEFVEDKIYERLLDSKMLIVSGNGRKVLKFPYRHMIVFENVTKLSQVKLDSQQTAALGPYISYANFYPTDAKGGKANSLKALGIFSHFRKPYDEDNFECLTEDECIAIFERLAPEYVVVMSEKADVTVEEHKEAVSEDDMAITGNEAEYKTFFLDEYQVGLVNEMGTGHRVLLANPGAGKSVILLSKAYKYASMYKNSKVLLTCFNANLADSYRFKVSCANFGDNHNLYVMNVHRLVEKIYREILHERMSGAFATDGDFRHLIELIKDGKVDLKFKAIFIDEVQNFNPLYLELCYRLLDQSADDLFLMAGDLNQDIKSNSRKGTVPWRQMNGIDLDFRGRVKYIEKNYRNSIEIGNYVSHMLKMMNRQLEGMGCVVESEYRFDTFVNGSKHGLALKVQTRVNQGEITEKLLTAVHEITERYGVPYSDIAILFPYRQFRYARYFFFDWVKNALKAEGIPYCMIISGDLHDHKTKVGQTSGIVLSTIESSLGLDFRAVIVAGLYPYNYITVDGKTYGTVHEWYDIRILPEEQRLAVQKQMHQIYTACSRARDVLYVLSDLNPDTPMEEILMD